MRGATDRCLHATRTAVAGNASKPSSHRTDRRPVVQSNGHINLGESLPMAPLVVKDKVLVGNSGGEFGVRGWLTALNAADGKIAWRAYYTGPDAYCLIGENFRPYYPLDQGKELGVTASMSRAVVTMWRLSTASTCR